jgi:ABC-type Zn uptake system ZnuABC Zn-binding protein ZnuA
MSAGWKTGAVAAGLAGLFVLFAALPGCRNGNGNVWDEEHGLRVVASFPPLYCFARNVGGDNIAVRSLLTNEGPHGYQYSARDVQLLRNADVFLANGLKLDDHFTDNIRRSCNNADLLYVKCAECIDRDRLEKMKEGGGQVCPHHPPGSDDPHVWLGIPEAIEMVHCVRDALKKKDPAHAADYDCRADAYVENLKKLHADGRKQLADKNVKLISTHESLTYFARSFGITVVGSIQLAPGDEPSGDRLRELAQLCVKEGVHLIAVEPQYPANMAQTLRSALKGKVDPVRLVTIDPLETAEPQELDAGWYERKMAENIANLAEAVP